MSHSQWQVREGAHRRFRAPLEAVIGPHRALCLSLFDDHAADWAII